MDSNPADALDVAQTTLIDVYASFADKWGEVTRGITADILFQSPETVIEKLRTALQPSPLQSSLLKVVQREIFDDCQGNKTVSVIDITGDIVARYHLPNFLVGYQLMGVTKKHPSLDFEKLGESYEDAYSINSIGTLYTDSKGSMVISYPRRVMKPDQVELLIQDAQNAFAAAEKPMMKVL